MLKAKKYDWKDSNMALFGSDTEKKVSLINFVSLLDSILRDCVAVKLFMVKGNSWLFVSRYWNVEKNHIEIEWCN